MGSPSELRITCKCRGDRPVAPTGTLILAVVITAQQEHAHRARK